MGTAAGTDPLGEGFLALNGDQSYFHQRNWCISHSLRQGARHEDANTMHSIIAQTMR